MSRNAFLHNGSIRNHSLELRRVVIDVGHLDDDVGVNIMDGVGSLNPESVLSTFFVVQLTLDINHTTRRRTQNPEVPIRIPFLN